MVRRKEQVLLDKLGSVEDSEPIKKSDPVKKDIVNIALLMKDTGEESKMEAMKCYTDGAGTEKKTSIPKEEVQDEILSDLSSVKNIIGFLFFVLKDTIVPIVEIIITGAEYNGDNVEVSFMVGNPMSSNDRKKIKISDDNKDILQKKYMVYFKY